MTLPRSRPFPSHDWPEGYDAGPPQTCTTCHTEWREGFETPPPWPCKRQPPERKKGLKPVSDRKAEKRSSSVTGEKLQMGPVCDWIRRQRCFLAAFDEHTCERRPDRNPIEPCHLDRRGKGHGDWRAQEGSVELRVAPGCPKAHDALDGNRGCDGLTSQQVSMAALVKASQLQKRCPVSPPEHVRMEAEGEMV